MLCPTPVLPSRKLKEACELCLFNLFQHLWGQGEEITPPFSAHKDVHVNYAKGGLWSPSTSPIPQLSPGEEDPGPGPPGWRQDLRALDLNCRLPACTETFPNNGLFIGKSSDRTEKRINTGIQINSYSITQRWWLLTFGCISFWSSWPHNKIRMRENIQFCVPITFNPTEGGGRLEKMGII